MKPAIYFFTHDLIPGREKLMPWRTLLEVAGYLQKAGTYTTQILSAEKGSVIKTRMYENIPVVTVPKPEAGVKIFPDHQPGDLLFWPVSWRTGSSSFSLLAGFKGIKIAYIPGGVYPFQNVIRAIGKVPINTLLPYLAEAIMPRKNMVENLKKAGFCRTIAFSDYTGQTLITAGWPKEKTVMIPPGYDPPENQESDPQWFHKFGLNEKKYFLFLGSPAPLRGGNILLQAFDEFAGRQENAHLVCLLRADPGVEKNKFDQTLSSLSHSDKVRVFWGKMNRGELKPFIENAMAIVLPFLLVPSEIPVTFFEVLSLGIPVITFENGGTSRYIGPASIICKPASARSLAEGMQSIWQSDELHTLKSDNAARLMKSHPTWKQMCGLWEEIITACSSS